MQFLIFILGVITGIFGALFILFLYFHIKSKKFSKEISSIYEKQLEDMFEKY